MSGASGKSHAAIKNAKEIARLAKAARITSGIFRIISRMVKPGASEKEIAGGIERLIKQKGLRRSFRTIVASGANAAMPHARLTPRTVKKNDVVVIDFGVIYKGYRSDLTRTVFIGKPDSGARKLYRVVKNAQARAIRKARPGLKISNFVKDVNDYMRKKGFGKYIRHSLGHGIGQKIHEAPKLSEKNEGVLKRNMVITIEPGLYIKDKTGVRIEDMIVLTPKGRKVLTR